MITLLLILLLFSNALTTRRDQSILFGRIIMQNIIFIIFTLAIYLLGYANISVSTLLIMWYSYRCHVYMCIITKLITVFTIFYNCYISCTNNKHIIIYNNNINLIILFSLQ